MYKCYLFLVAVIFAAIFTSCSNDVLWNNDALNNGADGDLPETRAGAATTNLVKTMSITVDNNTRQYALVYNSDGQLDSVYVTTGGRTYPAWVDRSEADSVIVRYVNELGDVMRYTYKAVNSSLISAEEAYDSDGYLIGKMEFDLNSDSSLTAIRLGEENDGTWSFLDVAAFMYDEGATNFTTVTEEETYVFAEFNPDWKYEASFDLNLWAMYGVGSSYGDILNFAILLDLFKPTTELLSELEADENNKVNFDYVMDGTRALSCVITAIAQEEDEDTQEIITTTTTMKVTFGY